MIRIDREALIDAPRARVWNILARHEDMPRWFPAEEVIRRRSGGPDPDGVGAVRVVRMRGLAIEERITAFKPEERIEYALVAGAPVRDLRAEVVLSPAGDRTRVRWSATLRPLVPGTGWLARRMLDAVVRDALAGLARQATRL